MSDYLNELLDLTRDSQIYLACPPKDIRQQDGDIAVTIPFQKQIGPDCIRSETQVQPELFTMVIRGYGPNVLRCAIGFGHPPFCQSPMLELNPGLKPVPLSVTASDHRWLVIDHSGRQRCIFDRDDFQIERWSDLVPGPEPTLQMTLLPDGKRPIRISAYDQFTPTLKYALGLAFIRKDNDIETVTISFQAEPDEVISGTGERFAKLDLSGRTIWLVNQDAHGANGTRGYKNVPFLVSSRLYGLFIHTSAATKLSIADHSARSIQVVVKGPILDLFVIAAEDLEQILYRYRQITGFPAMPPTWSFGTWMSRMSYFSQAEVMQVCKKLRSDGFPCDVVHIDTGWFKTNWICDWRFSNERFPDPARLISDLRAMGFRLSLWQLPYISDKTDLYQQAIANHYLGIASRNLPVKDSTFSVEDYAGTIDLTNPQAVLWYKDLLRRLLQMGISCIKTDFGEEIHMDASYLAMESRYLRNLYALLYQKAVFEVTTEVTKQGIIWARAGWAGCQRYPVHWAGDASSSWDGMAGTLRGGLHLGLSGFGFWSHDIPGFHGLPDFMNSVIPDDLYVRWTQFGVFTSHMRYHGTSKREPYHYPRVASIVKRWLRLRYSLIPYIIQQAQKVTCSGYPILRALVFHHPRDPVCWHIDDEYYFGDAFLVAPIINDRGSRNIYLPEGRWINLFDGSIKQGPCWIYDYRCPLDQMPVWVRYGAIVPVYPKPVLCTDQMDMSAAISLRFDRNYKGLSGSLLAKLFIV